MNNYSIIKGVSYGKIFPFIVLLYSGSGFSQLVGSKNQIWEKNTPISRDAIQCTDDKLLNFHCGIKDKLRQKYFNYSKNKSQTFSLVHTSKEDEQIWENKDKKISLNNSMYTKGGKENPLKQKPSIFTYSGTADPRMTKDSLTIKFRDQNLFEIIFFPRKAKPIELNKIHSYLSIKYGISLERGKYYQSDADIIWDPEKHKEYKYRPTGLGRDDGNELYQKQSSNQADSFLAIGMNSIMRTNADNPSVLENNNFVIWSDDNKAMSLKKERNTDILERNWEISFIGNKTPKTDYQVRITKETVNPKALPLSYWMLLKKDNGDIKKVVGVESEKYITFSKVDFLDAFDSVNTAYFTFAVGPKDRIENGSDPKLSGNFQNQYNEKDFSLDLSKISMYPNPVKKDQNFTITFPPMENLNISIYDGGGRLIRLDKVNNTARSYIGHLPIQSSYLINLTQNGKIIKTFKLIVD